MTIAVGSQEWARRTQGRLNRRERLLILRQVMRRQLPQLLRLPLTRLFANSRALDVDAIPLPDSPLCREALDYCAQVSPQYLYNHCLRTYFWGALVAQHDRLAFDAELFWLAALLHDLGLTPEKGHYPGCGCFAVAGAESAEVFLVERSYEAEKARRVYEAISRHMNVSVGVQEGVEAHLLQAGAAFDVVGLNWQKIDKASRLQVLATHPRLDMKKEFVATLRADAALHPESRNALLQRLGFAAFVKLSPFPE